MDSNPTTYQLLTMVIVAPYLLRFTGLFYDAGTCQDVTEWGIIIMLDIWGIIPKLVREHDNSQHWAPCHI